mgnify:CR=1 FL=1
MKYPDCNRKAIGFEAYRRTYGAELYRSDDTHLIRVKNLNVEFSLTGN